MAAEKGLGFAVERSADLPVTITTDQQRLDQILRNLLDNAFKFTESGSVTLRITRAEAADPEGATLAGGTGAIAFSVADTGIGIEADKQQIIFEAFQQADGSTSRNYGGTGLGLSISRELAHALGGKIRVQSRIGEGSTFTLYLPAPLHLQPSIDERAEPVMNATREEVAAFDASPIAYRKALVVDDDPRNLYAMRIRWSGIRWKCCRLPLHTVQPGPSCRVVPKSRMRSRGRLREPGFLSLKITVIRARRSRNFCEDLVRLLLPRSPRRRLWL